MQIIVEHNDDYTGYWDASSIEQWAKSALHILKQRHEQGWYHEPNPPVEPQEMSEDAIKQMPGDLRARYEHSHQVYRNALRYYDQARRWYDEMKRVVEENDLSYVTYRSGRTEPRAWKLLDERGDHEYERCELEDVQAPDPTAAHQ